MLKFAIANLRHHKYTSMGYVLLIALSATILLVLNTLILIILGYLQPIKNLLHESVYLKGNSTIFFQLNNIVERLYNLYDSIFSTRFSFLIIMCVIFFFFFLILQIKKFNEVKTWQYAGGSWLKWVGLSLLSTILPIVVLFLFLSFLLLIFSPLLSQLVLESDLARLEFITNQEIDHLTVTQFSHQVFSYKIIVHIPTEEQRLLASIDIPQIELINIIFRALGKTFGMLLIFIGLIDFIISTIHSYLRHLNVKKKNFN